MIRLVAVAALALLAGCVNGPPSWSGAPPLVGELHRAGAPLAHVPVRLVARLDANDNLREGSLLAETRTDAQGRFSMGPLGKKSHAARVSLFGIAESAANWGLQVQQDGQWQPLWKSQRTIGYAPRAQVRADCDLARDVTDNEIAGIGAAARGTGVCQLSLATARR